MSETVGALESRLQQAQTGATRTRLGEAIERATDALIAQQHEDGHWRFELEADCTIPAEYILMMHFVDEIDEVLEHKIARYLRRHQGADGGWPLYEGGDGDISCTVKAYYALKITGDDPQAAHMRRARRFILERGGAARANVFTRIMLAQFRQVPWRAVPYIPVEIMLLPRWFPFHLAKVSYWSRTVMVPLFILCTRREQAANPRSVDVRELFVVPPEEEENYFPVWSTLNRGFVWLDRLARLLDPLMPGPPRRYATRCAEKWFVARLNGTDGLGAIFPAMVNAYEALLALGYPRDHHLCEQARTALRKLLIVNDDEAYCQPCLSPIWDTVLSAMALQESGIDKGPRAAEAGLDWLCEHQVLEPIGDWIDKRPDLPAGGWAFQYANPHYPDLDDTGMIGWSLLRASDPARYRRAIDRAADWLAGMQSSNGGFAAFDIDNTYDYLNEIPFADHGALLDPPTEDVTARVLAFLSRLQRTQDEATRRRCIEFLRSRQQTDGSWFGRWGTNYIYGTWSVLAALEETGVDMSEMWVRRAVEWLRSRQRDDGGWGESNDSYHDPSLAGCNDCSTAHHTAWALLGLMAAGEVHTPTVQRGIDWLLAHQGEDGLWWEPWFNAPGFPRVFYLRYHGYPRFFPLWALGRYRGLIESAQ